MKNEYGETICDGCGRIIYATQCSVHGYSGDYHSSCDMVKEQEIAMKMFDITPKPHE